MRKEFNIKYRPQIESGEYKVVTDCGEPVEIVKWNCKGECPILAVIDDGDVEDTCFFNEAGISPHGTDSLYVITEEVELTEFEKELGKAIYTVFVPEELSKTEISSLKDNAKKLLDITRKQISEEKKEENNRIALGIYSNKELTDFQRLLGGCIMEAQCSVVDPLVHSVEWSDALLEEALKDMPKWKLNLSDTSNLPDAYSIVHEFEAGKDYSCITRMLECGNYRIKIEDLWNKLPKEE